MNNNLIGAIAFAAGAAIGSVITWQLLKTKYERIAQEEIDSVKEVFSRRTQATTEQKKDDTAQTEASPVVQEREVYINMVHEQNYKEEKDADDPYVISPEEFDELDGYDAVSLTYFADGVLIDDWGERVENVDELIGVDSLKHFGEYEDDSVFVRNDRLRTDYEILYDMRNYREITVNGLHPEDE